MLLGRYRHNRPPCTPPELVRGFPQLDIERARLVAVGPDNPPAFTATRHSHLPRASHRGLLYALGVRRGGRLVCVGTVGAPRSAGSSRRPLSS